MVPDTTSPSPDGRKTRGRRGALRRGLLPELVGYRLRKAQIAMFQSFQAAVAPHEITPGQFGLLVLIRENTGLSQSQLGAAVGIDRSTMVAAIDRLEGRGWVVRAPSPTDRRSYALRLGSEGDRLLDELIPKVRAHEDAMLAGMDAGERRQLLDLLGRLAGSA